MSLLVEQPPGKEITETSVVADAAAVRPLMEVRNEAMTQCDSTYLQNLLKLTKGNLSAAARLAGIHRKSLAQLLKKYGITIPRSQDSDSD